MKDVTFTDREGDTLELSKAWLGEDDCVIMAARYTKKIQYVELVWSKSQARAIARSLLKWADGEKKAKK